MGGIFTNIKSIVQGLIKKYNTNDPFRLAEECGFIVICRPLGTIKGFYKLIKRRRVIYINSNLDYFERMVVCAHELGHAIMHPKVNCSYLQNYTLLSVAKVEIEANKFCAYLLLTDKLLQEYPDFTMEQIASATNIPVEIVRLRQAQR